MGKLELNVERLDGAIESWLQEDIGTGDVTTLATIPADHTSKAIIHMKQAGIIAGLPIAHRIFRKLDAKLQLRNLVEEGSWVDKGTVVMEIEGASRSILIGERLVLNLLQRLSGIATKTNEYTRLVHDLPVRIVDTRKTTPGHRMLEKYAVRVGGGANHRFGLYDAVMIKDNHIKASGGITAAIEAARQTIPHTMKIEIEVENAVQLEEALSAQADIIMLDNMHTSEMEQAVKLIRTKAPHVIIEASGGVQLTTLRKIAETGVDVISVGALTHSVLALDISLDLDGKKEEVL